GHPWASALVQQLDCTACLAAQPGPESHRPPVPAQGAPGPARAGLRLDPTQERRTLMLKRLLSLAALLMLVVASAAHADEASIRKAMKAKFPELDVQSVTKLPYLGLY